jgi:hypothetical protein
MELIDLDTHALLRRAREAGLVVNRMGDTLAVRGPKRLADWAQCLLARKPEVLALLALEESTKPYLTPAAEALGNSDGNKSLRLNLLAHRDELAQWPIPWRQRWGELANELEDQGLLFPENERQAFCRTRAEMAEYERYRGPIDKAEPAPPPESDEDVIAALARVRWDNGSLAAQIEEAAVYNALILANRNRGPKVPASNVAFGQRYLR